jgi:hypothetical protein
VPRLRGKVAGLIVATAAVLLVAACGGGSSSASTTSAPGTGGAAGNNAFTAYVDCLNKNGVPISLPSGGPRTRPSGGAGPYGNRPSGAARPYGNRPSGAARQFGGGGTRPSGAPRPHPSGSAGARFPGGGFGNGGGFFGKPANVDDATWQKAQQACASVRPSAGPGGAGRRGAGGTQNAAFANCMKDHGVTSLQNLSTTDPTVKKALAVCQVLRQAQPSATPTA